MHPAGNDPDESPTVSSAVEWDGNHDGSYIGLFGHTQLIGGAVVLALLAAIRRSSSRAVWTAVLEVLVWSDSGSLLGCAVPITYVRSSDVDQRDSRALLGRLALLAVLAAGVDMLHVIADPYVSHPVPLALVLLETSGEPIGMTLIVLATHRMFLRTTLAVP